MSYSNYRNNMPHYDSMPHNYDPMGINNYKTQNKQMRKASSLPRIPGIEEFLRERPFIPDSEMPFEIDGDIPAIPQMPGMPQQGMPGMQQPNMPGMQQPNMPGMQQPTMPGMQQPTMPGMQQPTMPGMQQPTMPGMQQPTMPGMQQPAMPGMPFDRLPITCEQLREFMRLMNCPMNDNNMNGQRPMAEDI